MERVVKLNISNDIIEEFQRDGVVVLRGVFRDWIEVLAAGVAEVMKHPSPRAGSGPMLASFDAAPPARRPLRISPSRTVRRSMRPIFP
jgi:hypothetical protein